MRGATVTLIVMTTLSLGACNSRKAGSPPPNRDAADDAADAGGLLDQRPAPDAPAEVSADVAAAEHPADTAVERAEEAGTDVAPDAGDASGDAGDAGDAGDTAARDAAPVDTLGAPYPCETVFNVDAGAVLPDGAVDGAVPPAICTVGQTYCNSGKLKFGRGIIGACAAIPDACKTNPTCACLQLTGLFCTCADGKGFLSVTCDQI
jgi:hypothetical protein